MTTPAIRQPTAQHISAPRAEGASLGFTVLAFAALVGCLVLFMVRPPFLGGGSGGLPAAGVGLLLAGWGATFLFALGTAVAPRVAGADLRSPGTARVHLQLHALGLIGLMAGAWTGQPLPQAGGALLIGAGGVLFVLNGYATASGLNRWTPANLLILSALFWLLADTGIAAYLTVSPRTYGLPVDEQGWQNARGQLMLAGFVWQLTAGCLLHLTEATPPRGRPPGVASWAGLTALNLSLVGICSAGPGRPEFLDRLLGGLLATGMFLLVVDLVAAQDRSTPGEGGVPTVAALAHASAALMLAAMLPAPGSGLAPVLACLSLLTVAWVTVLARLVPDLSGAQAESPQAEGASVGGNWKGVSTPHLRLMTVAMAPGAAFLTAAAAAHSPAGMQVGSVLLLVGVVWFFLATLPSWRHWLSQRQAAARRPSVHQPESPTPTS